MYKVMIVEDEKIIRAGLKKIVEQFDSYYQVAQECEDGLAAWEAFQFVRPDLIITDIRMRKLTGLELIEKIRQAGWDTCIIIISGYSEFEYAKKAVKYHVYDYVLKPLDFTEFSNILLKVKKTLDARGGGQPQAGPETGEGRRMIKKAREFIRENIGGDVSLRTVATVLGVSANYLSALFKTDSGMNFSDFVIAERMRKARALLQESNLKIYEIAAICGYASPKHFANTFKKTVGMTPQQYKNE